MKDRIIELAKQHGVKYGIIVTIAIVLLYLFFNYSILIVSVNTPDNLPKVVDTSVADHIESEEDSKKSYEEKSHVVDPKIDVSLRYHDGVKFIGRPGIHLVKRGMSNIEVESSNSMTRSVYSAPWYGIGYKNITLKLDTNANKVAYLSTADKPCGVYSEKLNRISQYSCGDNPATQTYYSTPSNGEWRLESLANLHYPYTEPAHYKGGLLGITESSKDPKTGENTPQNTLLRSTSDTGDVTFFEQPEDVKCKFSVCLTNNHNSIDDFIAGHNLPARIFTDTKNQGNSNFIFVSSDGVIYLGKPQRDSSAVDYTKIEPPENFNAKNQQTLCDIGESTAICYQGLSSKSTKETTSEAVPTTLTKLSFEKGLDARIKMEPDTIFTDIGISSDGKIFATDFRDLLLLDVNSSQTRIKQTRLATGVTMMGVGADVHYISGNSIFKVESDTLSNYQVFHSQHIRPRNLITTKDTVLFIGYAPRSAQNPSYAWKLNQQPNTTPGYRAIDQLPTPLSSTAYGKVDLIDDMLYIQPQIDRSTVITQTLIDRHKKKVLDNLKKSGVNIDNLKVVLPYGLQ